MTKPVLAIDFDDVVNDFNHAFLAYNQQQRGALKTYDELDSYNYCIDYSISQEEMHDRIWDFCHNFHDSIQPLEGAVDTLAKLHPHFSLHLVTSRCESLTDITHGWLDREAPGLFVETHFTNGFATRHPERRRTKLEVCRAIAATALIDDALTHVGHVADELQVPVFMPTRPWNKHDTPPGVTRIKNISDVLPYLLTKRP